MAVTTFFSDAALTTPLVAAITFTQNLDGTTGDVDAVIYLGDTDENVSLYAASDPGVDAIVVSINDTNDSVGDSPQAVDVKLATSSGGLGSAVGGASLSLGTSIAGGVANAVAIHIRMATPTVPIAGIYSELSLSTNTLVKY